MLLYIFHGVHRFIEDTDTAVFLGMMDHRAKMTLHTKRLIELLDQIGRKIRQKNTELRAAMQTELSQYLLGRLSLSHDELRSNP